MQFRYIVIILLATIFTSCTITRGIKYGNAAVDDYTVFEQDIVRHGSHRFDFNKTGDSSALDTLKFEIYRAKTDTTLHLTIRQLMDYFADTPSAAMIVQDDNIIFEHYSGGWSRDSKSCIFSVTKTITSMLCGIALKEGHIKSVDDYVVDYIPELKSGDKRFAELKIEHLLDMTAGLKFDENYTWNPFSKMAKLYMGNNSLKTLKSLKFSHNPGENFSYDSATTAILGIVIERATGKSYAEYLSEKVWQPLGMESDAMIGLDDKRHRVAKSYAGLTTNIRDLAKVGRLFLNNGNWNGKQIIDSAYVARCHSPHTAGIKGKVQGRYSYSWYWSFTDSYYIHNSFDSKSAMDNYYSKHPEIQVVKSTKNDNTYTTIEYHRRRYFDSVEALKEYYRGRTDMNVYRIWGNRIGYYAVLHNGGYWAYGLYGQVLYINPEKRLIGVFLGADRLKDFTLVFDAVCSGRATIM